jgi:hypothetical protein
MANIYTPNRVVDPWMQPIEEHCETVLDYMFKMLNGLDECRGRIAECEQLGLRDEVDRYSRLLAEMERDFFSTASRMINDVRKHRQDIIDASRGVGHQTTIPAELARELQSHEHPE